MSGYRNPSSDSEYIRYRSPRRRRSSSTDGEDDESDVECFWDGYHDRNGRDKRQKRYRKYLRPRSLDQRWLSFDIPLTVVTSPNLFSGRTQSEELADFSRNQDKVKEFRISAAIYRTGEDDAKIDLNLVEESKEWNGMRWYHIQQDELQLDPLIDIVNSAPGLSANNRLLAAGLLRELHAECSWKHRTNRLPAGLIRRHCEKRSHRENDHPDTAVTFMSVPFFSHQVRPAAISSSQSPTTTLLQAEYPDENIDPSSDAHSRPASKAPPGAPELCVSHLWLLLCDKGMLPAHNLLGCFNDH